MQQIIYSNYILGIQVVISLVTMCFSISMLSLGKDPGIYLPILTSIVSVWLPSPVQNIRSIGSSQQYVVSAANNNYRTALSHETTNPDIIVEIRNIE